MPEKRKWTPAFIPPDLYDIIRDYIMDQGDKDHIYSPRILVIRAVEEYLTRKGYSVQIEEIRSSLKTKIPVRVFSLDKLTQIERSAVSLIMKWKKMGEQEAIKWVVDHPDEVKAAVEEIDVEQT